VSLCVFRAPLQYASVRKHYFLATMNAIMHYQEEYFLGDETKLADDSKDIAIMVGLKTSRRFPCC
jgi:hypothetical protein